MRTLQLLNVKQVCTVVQMPDQVPAPLCPVAPDGCHPSYRGWRSSCPDNLFWCYFVYHVNFSPETVLLTCGAMSRFTEWVSALLMLDVPNNPQWAPSCRGQFNLEKLAMSSHRSHCGSRPAPTGFYSNLEKPQSKGVHCQKKSNAILSLPYKACFMWCERYYLYKGRLHDILNCWYMTRAVDPWVHSALGNVWILRITKHYKHTNKQNAFVRFCNGFLIFKRPLHSQSQFSG